MTGRILIAVAMAVAAAALWAAAGAVHAQELGNTEIKVTAYTDIGPDGPSLGEITVGLPVSIAIEVSHPATTQIVFPRIEPEWDDVFELRGSPQVSSQERDGRLVTTKTFEVVAFRPGEHETPPLIVTVLSPGNPPLDQSAGLLKLNVVPVLAEDEDEPMDIRGQVDMTGPLLDLDDLAAPSSWPWIVGALALIGLACWGLYMLLRPRIPEPVVIDPYEAAIAELDRIEGLGLPAAGRFKEHYTLVADVIRTYLEGEFGIPALDRTTSEIQAEIRGTDIPDDGAVEMRWLFVDCDIIKFTGLEPNEYEAGLMVGRAREILGMIRPAETPPEAEGAGQIAEAAGA